MHILERMKAFFDDPPQHALKVGDMVTCACHGGIAIIIHLYDDHAEVPMNMAKLWWIKPPHNFSSRVWMHTIKRLDKYPPEEAEREEAYAV
jgi:hypothetical protein